MECKQISELGIENDQIDSCRFSIEFQWKMRQLENYLINSHIELDSRCKNVKRRKRKHSCFTVKSRRIHKLIFISF